MADLSKLKLRRGTIKGQLTRAKSFLDNVDTSNLSEIDIIQLKSRLDIVEPILSQFEDVQLDIESLLLLSKDDDNEIDQIIQN